LGAGASGLAAYVGQQLDPSLAWDDLAWLRARTRLPIVLKGVLHPEDARLAVEQGCAGIVVSNHGGRQLDQALASLDALPEVVEAVRGRCEIFMDGGVRRGTDALVALALGARGVLLGRPVLWGLALGGADGVAAVLEHARGELSEAMALCGVRSPSEVARGLVVPAPGT
jgi:4-hydroxymandelate oxidase